MTELLFGTVTGVCIGVLILMQIEVVMSRRRRREWAHLGEIEVEWVGGPLDQQRFWVDEDRTTIRVHLAPSDEEYLLPIEKVGGRHYVIWKESHG